MGRIPFREGDTFETFRKHVEKIIGEIDSLGDDYALKKSQEELESEYINRVSIQPLVLYPDRKYLNQKEGLLQIEWVIFD